MTHADVISTNIALHPAELGVAPHAWVYEERLPIALV